ncbi:MAG: rod shape-determining protein MreC [Candidatus Sungiibacteriota bacterium]|uniref:Cell shape-determining protein MreC n=1 Tax=Candidatus Sungiibacteriota bacterium TaxID=2750080 RepID=A0A7T5RJB2_9BACT|nr:MAG: rod shape-determining protein MreC [Candidatus Sungbacteria bacterium]
MMRRGQIIKVVAAVILLGLLIFFSNAGFAKSIRMGIVLIFRPLMKISQAVRGTSLKLSDKEVLDLVKENQRLKASLFDAEKLKLENESLKKALGFKETVAPRLRGARVLLHARELGKELLVVDHGENSGIKKGMLVTDSNRMLVGRVFEAGPNIAKISVASNPEEAFEADIIPLRVRTLIKGIGGKTFSLELISADAALRQGDFVMLSGKMPLLAGEITSIGQTSGSAFKEVRASLLSRPETLQEVFIISSP